MIGTPSRNPAVLQMPLPLLIMIIISALHCEAARALPVDEVRRAQTAQTEKDKADTEREAKQAAAAKSRAAQPTKRDAPHAHQRKATDPTTPLTAATPAPPAPRVQAPFAAEIEGYINVFSKQNTPQQIQACRELEFAGLSDPRIFDLVEHALLQVYQTAHDGDSVAYATWLTRALAYSGQEKYRNTLQLVAQHAGHRKLSKQASASLKILDDYTVWTPIIGNTANYNRDKSPDLNRLMNMVRSPVASLQLLAANRMITTEQYDPLLLQALQQQVSDLLGSKADDATEEALVWMLRALASSRNAEYRPVLQQAAAHAASSHVRKYAASYLKKFY